MIWNRTRFLVLVPGLLAVFVASPAQAKKFPLPPTTTQAIGRSIAGNVLGTAFGASLSALGLFDAIGLGQQSDPEINAKLDEILNDLQDVKADLTTLQNDFTALSTNLSLSTDKTGFATQLAAMSAARQGITDCLGNIEKFAATPGTDKNDEYLRGYAEEIVGLPASTSSECSDLVANFEAIDRAIVGDMTLGGANEGAYTLLARILKQAALHPKPGGSVSFENLANHFVQYALIQHEALELIRNAYTVLGQAKALDTELKQHDFLAKLRNEEIAFLKASDAYITYGLPTNYDAGSAQLADVIVQRLEGVQAEITSYSLSIVDNAAPFVPVLQTSGTTVAMSDKIIGTGSSAYYGMADSVLTAGITSCLGSQTQDGFAFVRPDSSLMGGFVIQSSCAVHVERHLARSVNGSLAWTVNSRAAQGGQQSLPIDTLNAATFVVEPAVNNLALAGDPGGANSGASRFRLVKDNADPRLFSLVVNLPGQPNLPIRFGQNHAFDAGPTGTVALFYREANDADRPDRAAFSVNNQYLSIGKDGFAALSDGKFYFDVRPLPDGTSELDYDGGALYVDYQYQQGFFAETPDTYLAAPSVDLAGEALQPQWEKTWQHGGPSNALALYPACVDANGSGLPWDDPECSDHGFAYNRYGAKLLNTDPTRARRFKWSYKASMSFDASTLPNSNYTSEVGGIHCFVNASDQYDTPFSYVNANIPTLNFALPTAPTEWLLTVPPNSSLTVYCQVKDPSTFPKTFLYSARQVLTNFDVQLCSTSDGTCLPYTL